MTPAARQYLEGGGHGTTLDLRGVVSTAIPCDVNGIGDATICFWANSVVSWVLCPSFYAAGGWGGIHLGEYAPGALVARFGCGTSGGFVPCYLNTTFPDAGYGDATYWAHYAAVRDGTTVSFYVNGQLAGTGTGASDLTTNNGGFLLTGGLENSRIMPETYLPVGYASWAFFRRALPQEEVVAAMECGPVDTSSAPFDSGLVFGVNIDEGEGDRVYDVVSGRYAELSGTVRWNIEMPF